jgi:hypothetical protein
MFEKIKNNNILSDNEVIYCDEYIACEKEKLVYQIRHIENYIHEYRGCCKTLNMNIMFSE